MLFPPVTLRGPVGGSILLLGFVFVLKDLLAPMPPYLLDERFEKMVFYGLYYAPLVPWEVW